MQECASYINVYVYTQLGESLLVQLRTWRVDLSREKPQVNVLRETFQRKIRTVERKVNLKVKQAFIQWSMERSRSFPKGAGVDILGKGGKSARAM